MRSVEKYRNKLQAINARLQVNNDKYKKEIERLNNHKLGNINGLNQIKLDQLENTMIENLQRIKERRKELIEDKTLCMICKDNPKNIVVQGCNHADDMFADDAMDLDWLLSMVKLSFLWSVLSTNYQLKSFHCMGRSNVDSEYRSTIIEIWCQ